MPRLLDLNAALIQDPNTKHDSHADHAWLRDGRGEELFARAIDDPSQHVWVAQDGDMVVSFGRAGVPAAQYWRQVKRAQFFSLYVLPEYRSKGVGSLMFEHFFEWARGQGATVANLMVYANNVRAIELYERLGFHGQMMEMEREL